MPDDHIVEGKCNSCGKHDVLPVQKGPLKQRKCQNCTDYPIRGNVTQFLQALSAASKRCKVRIDTTGKQLVIKDAKGNVVAFNVERNKGKYSALHYIPVGKKGDKL